MKKYDKKDQAQMATWATDCAERVLDFFERAYPNDQRPRKAIETCRTWVRTGIFRMVDIRSASLGAHEAAREAKSNDAAMFAARAAGQAVATSHVAQHAFGAAYYALKAIEASDPAHADSKLANELDWQQNHVSKNLQEEVLKRVKIQRANNTIVIKVVKDKDF